MGFVGFMRGDGQQAAPDRRRPGTDPRRVVVGGTGGIVMAVIGVVPALAGIFNFCLFGPLFQMDFFGRPKARPAA